MIQYLFLMYFCHFVDDYCLQAFCLSKLKQKSSWEDYVKDNPSYKYDYLMALFGHAFMWAISIMIPTMISGHFIWWLIPINFIIHFIVDDVKANRGKINLITDQSIHLIQVLLTFLTCYYWCA